MLRRTSVIATVTVLVVACGGDKATSASSSGSSAPAVSSTAGSGPGAAATPSTTAKPDTGSVADLRKKASGVLDALKKGDTKAAADFCLGKHRDGLEKYMVEMLEKKEQSRAKAIAAWDGNLGEVRVDGDQARVAYGKGERVDYLSFRNKDGEWSLFDFPVTTEENWKAWGTVASE